MFDVKGEYRPEYVINNDWPDGDITAAVASARRQLGLKEDLT